MCPDSLAAAVTAIAAALAQGKSSKELSLLGAVLSQLGDTLSTMAAQMELCCKE